MFTSVTNLIGKVSQSSEKGEEDIKVVAIILPIGFIVVLVVIVGVLLWRRRQTRKRIRQDLFELHGETHSSSSNSNLYQHFPSTRQR